MGVFFSETWEIYKEVRDYSRSKLHSMRAKRKTICQTCRRRKLGCDGKRPACSQCAFSRLKCDGYSEEWTFVQQGAVAISPPSRGGCDPAAIPTRSQEKSLRHHHEHLNTSRVILSQRYLNRPDSAYFSDFIVQTYVPRGERATPVSDSDHVEPRICGSWVEVLSRLPSLTTGNSVLSRAITALGISIISRSNIRNVDCSQAYQSAIHMLRRSLERSGNIIKFEHIPAIMCITLVEFMIPDSVAAIAVHTRAVGLLFQAYNPKVFKSGTLHRLFVGFRPVMVIRAIQSRQPTFLALQSWIHIPFSVINPSLMQSLLNEVIMLSSLLHKSDSIIENPQGNDSADINNLLTLFLDLFARLESWGNTIWTSDDRSSILDQGLYTMKGSTNADTWLPLWYPSITMANVLTHLWAFQITCATEIERLAPLALNSVFDTQISASEDPFISSLVENKGRMIDLGRKIYLSMDYLLQDEMELFGPASTFYPLGVAYKRFKASQPEMTGDIAYIENIVERLAQKGLLASRSIILE